MLLSHVICKIHLLWLETSCCALQNQTEMPCVVMRLPPSPHSSVPCSLPFRVRSIVHSVLTAVLGNRPVSPEPQRSNDRHSCGGEVLCVTCPVHQPSSHQRSSSTQWLHPTCCSGGPWQCLGPGAPIHGPLPLVFQILGMAFSMTLFQHIHRTGKKYDA